MLVMLKTNVTGVDADVAGELVAAGETAVASVDGTGVGTFVHRRFAGP